eukprot:scaffold2501_cov423-Prasinococcus_capsulatus_cf.AAC.4
MTTLVSGFLRVTFHTLAMRPGSRFWNLCPAHAVQLKSDQRPLGWGCSPRRTAATQHGEM